MRVESFVETLGSEYFVGVPDSQLKALSSCLMDKYGIDAKHHLIAANEGNCVALAAGYHLATGKYPAIYMQNSGQGNAVNPLASLTSPDVYAIPTILIIGWRGEPGVHDEPQHAQQGRITLDLLDVLDIDAFVVDSSTSEPELATVMERFNERLAQGESVAFVVKKNALQYEGHAYGANEWPMTREEALRYVLVSADGDVVVSTTGKTSREVFELREGQNQGHSNDFLTVGSMGHASSIALGIAAQKPDRRIWCLDGDGAALMHMGSMALIGSVAPDNLVHIVFNNNAHESVGGMPTPTESLDFCSIASACGYAFIGKATSSSELETVLESARNANRGPSFIEIACTVGSRPDLGRPTTTPQQNKRAFMEALKG